MAIQISTLELPAGHCLEVCRGEQLIGYAIYFSGGWDAWSIVSPRHRSAIKAAARIVSSNTTKEAATEAIERDHDV